MLVSSLLLFRRYEQGLAERGTVLRWDERVGHLRDIYDHYALQLEEEPPFLWTRLFRDVLLVPHSPPYRAVTELLAADDPLGEVGRVTGHYDADPEVLRLAVGGVAAALA